MVLSADLAAAWPAHPVEGVTVTPPGQPTTGLWWTLLDRLTDRPGRSRPVVAADYDPDLRYLCLVTWEDAATADDGRRLRPDRRRTTGDDSGPTGEGRPDR